MNVMPTKLFLRWVFGRFGGPQRPPVFVIGFNKCGTKSLHHFFLANGYPSAHSTTFLGKRAGDFGMRFGRFAVAKRMQMNREARQPLLRGLQHYDVFSDIVYLTDSESIEANSFFREFAAQHKDAYFLFNDRPVEKWVQSRLSHEGGPRGSLVKRYAQAKGISEAEAPDLWRAEYAAHKAEVLAYFEGHPRFMHFPIESGRPEDLVAFFHADYDLDPALWMHRGSAAERARKQSKWKLFLSGLFS